jgi:DNA-binding NtrC family response regulator
MEQFKRLVLIDDDPGVLRALGLLLQTMQFQVNPFSSPAEALAFIAEKSEIDLIVTDLRMPEITGAGVLTEVRKHSQELPVIVMSGHATSSEVTELRRLGASGFIPKPFTPTQFHSVINSISQNTSSKETPFA